MKTIIQCIIFFLLTSSAYNKVFNIHPRILAGNSALAWIWNTPPYVCIKDLFPESVIFEGERTFKKIWKL